MVRVGESWNKSSNAAFCSRRGKSVVAVLHSEHTLSTDDAVCVCVHPGKEHDARQAKAAASQGHPISLPAVPACTIHLPPTFHVPLLHLHLYLSSLITSIPVASSQYGTYQQTLALTVSCHSPLHLTSHEHSMQWDTPYTTSLHSSRRSGSRRVLRAQNNIRTGLV